MEQVKTQKQETRDDRGGGGGRGGGRGLHAPGLGAAEPEGRLGLGRVSAQVRHSGARLRCREGSEMELSGQEEAWGEEQKGGEQWTGVKGADGWEIQQAGEERLGVMPTLGARSLPFTCREPRRRCGREEGGDELRFGPGDAVACNPPARHWKVDVDIRGLPLPIPESTGGRKRAQTASRSQRTRQGVVPRRPRLGIWGRLVGVTGGATVALQGQKMQVGPGVTSLGVSGEGSRGKSQEQALSSSRPAECPRR